MSKVSQFVRQCEFKRFLSAFLKRNWIFPMTQRTILVADDEALVRQALRQVLEDEGWRVREAETTGQMMQAVETGPVDLVTLDLGFCGETCDNGLDCARQLRRRYNVPVVVISGRSAPFDRASGLAAGADDYIVKPFENQEVAIRIRRILERYGALAGPRGAMTFAHGTVDLRHRVMRHHSGRQEELTGLEAQLLDLFLSHPSQILSRDEINRALHGRDWSPFDRSIDGHVARLRRKFEPEGEAPRLIRSVRGVGYVFTGEPLPET